MYGCTPWTLTKWLLKIQDEHYIRMQSAVLNKSWKQQPTKQRLYGHLSPITQTIQVRWTRHAGHCCWIKDKLISGVLLWTPTYGRTNVGRPVKIYIHQLCVNTGCRLDDSPSAMADRKLWREKVKWICAISTPWCWWTWESGLINKFGKTDISKVHLFSYLLRFWKGHKILTL